MSTITLRSVKGSPLTNNEVDDNFSNLNTDKYQSGASPDFVDTLTDKLSLDTAAAATAGVGEFAWDDGNGTAVLGLKGGNVSLQVGQEIVARCYNDSGVALSDGQVVYISGAQGNRVAVKLALATTDGTSAGTLGMVTESIAVGAEGFITILGTVNGLNTSSLTQGAIVYLSPTTAGAYTTTKPVAPQHTVTLGYVERVHATVGSIYVKVDNGYEIDELHNVLITSAASGNTLIYDATAGVWKNANLTDGTGISITEGAGSITIANSGVTQATAGTGISVSSGTGNVTITNTAPDQTVSLTGAGTTSISGTYPNFTITSNDEFDGTVTSVAATAGTGISVTGSPITSSGTLTITNTAPDQTVSLSAGTGISTSGTYPNFTVTNTAPDQTVALTAGTGISTSGTYPNFTITNTAPSSGGTVTSITAGTGLSGGTITSSGTIAIDSTVATLTGTQTLTNKTLTSPTLTTATTSGKFTFGGAIDETVFAITGTTPALSPTNGTIQTWTLSANSTPTAGTWDAGESMTMMINDSASSFTVTWTSLPVTWIGGSAPTLAPASGFTVIELWKVGSTIYGALVGSVA